MVEEKRVVMGSARDLSDCVVLAPKVENMGETMIQVAENTVKQAEFNLANMEIQGELLGKDLVWVKDKKEFTKGLAGQRKLVVALREILERERKALEKCDAKGAEVETSPNTTSPSQMGQSQSE